MKKRAIKHNKIQEIEDLSEISDISLMYSKLKRIKKADSHVFLFFCKIRNDKLIGGHDRGYLIQMMKAKYSLTLMIVM